MAVMVIIAMPISSIVLEDMSLSGLSYPQISQKVIAEPAMLAMMTGASLFAATVSIFLAAVFVDRRPFQSMGLQMDTRWWRDLAFGLALGTAVVGLIFLVQWIAGWVRVTGSGATEASLSSFMSEFLLLGIAFGSIGIYEELLTRGYQLTNIAEGLTCRRWGRAGGVVAAVIVSSALFGLLHSLNPDPTPLALVNVSLTGVLIFGPAYVLTGRLGLPIGFHISWNFAQSCVFGLPVSGIAVGKYPLLMTVGDGPVWWAGGSFGPEGGLLGTIAIVLAAGAILLWVQRQYGRIAIHKSLARQPKSSHSSTPRIPSDELK